MPDRHNSRLFQCGSTEIIDVNTGESTPVEGGGFRMLPGPPGTCEWCCVKHDPTEPHNQQSFPYQIKFQTLYGRAPTWSDAMAHCTPEVRRLWTRQLIAILTANGLEIPADLKEKKHGSNETCEE